MNKAEDSNRRIADVLDDLIAIEDVASTAREHVRDAYEGPIRAIRSGGPIDPEAAEKFQTAMGEYKAVLKAFKSACDEALVAIPNRTPGDEEVETLVKAVFAKVNIAIATHAKPVPLQEWRESIPENGSLNSPRP